MKLNKNMTIGELIRTYPQTVEVLMDFGMGCVGCPASQAETLNRQYGTWLYDADCLLQNLTVV